MADSDSQENCGTGEFVGFTPKSAKLMETPGLWSRIRTIDKEQDRIKEEVRELRGDIKEIHKMLKEIKDNMDKQNKTSQAKDIDKQVEDKVETLVRNEIAKKMIELQESIKIVINDELGKFKPKHGKLGLDTETVGDTVEKMVEQHITNRIKDIEDGVKHKVNKQLEQLEEVNKEKECNFKKIIKEQEEARKAEREEEVIKVIKSRENLVREVAEKKKSVIIIGVEEEKLPVRVHRERVEMEKVKNILDNLGQERNLKEEVDDLVRLGKYKEGEHRPLKLIFKSQSATEEALSLGWKLKESENFKNIYIRRNMNQEERQKLKEQLNDIKEKNDGRNEEEKKNFYWKLRNGKIVKWWIPKTK